MPENQILIVGSYCHDELKLTDGQVVRALGGSSAYLGRFLSALRVGFTIVAKVGEDFSYTTEVLQPPLVTKSQPTTAFRHEYVECETGTQRRERFAQVCEPLSAADVAKVAGSRRFAIGIACGVALETGLDVVREMRARTRWLIADAQSLLREPGAGGEVRLARFENTPFAAESALFDVIKFSETEARYANLQALAGHAHVIVTRGPRGALLYERGSRRLVECPAFAAREIDSTGAGDSFLAGFGFGLLNGLPLEQSLRAGNYCGALAVSQQGVPRIDARDLGLLLNQHEH